MAEVEERALTVKQVHKNAKKHLKKLRKNSPTKKELAAMKVLEEAGYSIRAISGATGRNKKTVKKWLTEHVAIFEDPQMRKLIDKLRSVEYEDLETINFKAKKLLHDRLNDEDNPPADIVLIAAMDRTFQQKEILRKEMGREIDPEKIMARMADKQRELEDLDTELEEIKKRYA